MIVCRSGRLEPLTAHDAGSAHDSGAYRVY